MTATRLTYRLLIALVATLLGVGATVPVASVACMGSMGQPTSTCSHQGPASHCDQDAHSENECLLVHHSNQDATPAVTSTDLDDGAAGSSFLRATRPMSPPSYPVASLPPSCVRPVPRSSRIHARVGVWIE